MQQFAYLKRNSNSVYATMWPFGKLWFLSRLLQNKRAHSAYGNMIATGLGHSGKGSGKGAQGEAREDVPTC